MPMDYSGNSNKDKQLPGAELTSKPVAEKIVTGEVIKKKPSLGHRFKTVFFGGDFGEAARYIAGDVLLPAVRNLFVDMATKGAERVFYGESRPRRPGAFSYPSRIQYNSPVVRTDPRGPVRLPDQGPRASRQRDPSELILASRDEAELVLERMSDIADQYGTASVADLYGLTGEAISHIDQKWGWTSLVAGEVRQVREGWLLYLPQPEEI